MAVALPRIPGWLGKGVSGSTDKATIIQRLIGGER